MADQLPFRFEIKKLSSTVFEIAYVGYMAERDHEHILQSNHLLSNSLGSLRLIYDLSQMTGFHKSQVARHGEMFLPHRTKITKIALIGAKPAMRFGALSISLLARLTVKFFDEKEAALSWLAMLQ